MSDTASATATIAPNSWPYLRAKLRWIWALWKPRRGWMAVLALLTLFSTASAIAYPLILGELINYLHEAASAKPAADGFSRTINDAIWILVVVALVRFLASFYPSFRAWVNSIFEKAVRERYFETILRKGHRFFIRFRTGDIVTRLTDDISDFPKIAWFCCSGIFRAVESGAKVAFCLAVMFVLNWELALWSLTPVPIMLVIWALVRMRLMRASEAQRKAASRTNEHLESAFSGVRILQAYNGEARQGDALRAQLGDRINAEMDLAKTWTLVTILYQTCNVIGQIVVIVVGGLMVIENRMSIGVFYAFYTYLGMLIAPMIDLPNLFVTSRQAFVCIDREEEMRTFDVVGEGGALKGDRPAEAGPVRLAGVACAYPTYVTEATPDVKARKKRRRGRPDSNGATSTPETNGTNGTPVHAAATSTEPALREVLRDVALDIRPGERVAVVGMIGAGKTTLARIVAGIVVPTAGDVTLSGRHYAEIDRTTFRDHVAYVPQEPVLFSASIRENIEFGRGAQSGFQAVFPSTRPSDATQAAPTSSADPDSYNGEHGLQAHATGDAAVWEAIEIAGMRDEVEAFPTKLDHEVGLRGEQLSGGQRQRLTIARALYGRPSLLVLDDITAALDAENEERFWHALFERQRDLAALVITHRAATARRMDRIVVLDNGRVAAQGTHEELLKASSFYQRFHLEHDDPVSSRRASAV